MYACVVVHMSMDVCIVVHPKCMCGIHVFCMFTYKYLLAKKKLQIFFISSMVF
jgi:hypothetical protein